MTLALEHLEDLTAFVEASPSSYHTVAEVGRRLRKASFMELRETHAWPSESGHYFVVRDGAVIAWSSPALDAAGATVSPVTPFRIIGSHTDSPGFKLKPKPTRASHGWLQAGVETYGSPLYNSWLDRELEFAGRLVFVDGTSELVRTGPFLRFPQLAVHLDRAVNTAGLVLNPQVHLTPVIGTESSTEGDIVGHLAYLAGRTGAEVVGYDVAVADTAPPRCFGIDNRLFASGRLDNLASVHAGLVALLDSVPARGGSQPPATIVYAAFDHEEVGSNSTSGASGSFLEDVLTRLTPDPVDRARAFAASMCLSLDAGHALHPNYPERHDPANRPLVNAGPLLKINADQRYATDGFGAAEWVAACARAGVGYQEFVSNNAVPCGLTIGPLTATRLGIRTVDVGIALLSMHSARELCGVDDPYSLALAVGAFVRPDRANLVRHRH